MCIVRQGEFVFREHQRIDEAIAYMGIGEEVPGLGGIVRDFLPQLAHEGSQVLDLFAVVRSPDGGEELGVGDGATGMTHEVVQNLVLLAGEADGLSVFGDRTARWRETEVADLNWRVFGTQGSVETADGGADAGDQLAHAEGLGDIIIRPQLERLHLFLLSVAHRDHDDGESGRECGAGFPDRQCRAC